VFLWFYFFSKLPKPETDVTVFSSVYQKMRQNFIQERFFL